MDIDFFERNLTVHYIHAHHHHAGNPEKDDVKAGDQNITRVITRQIIFNGVTIFGPTKC